MAALRSGPGAMELEAAVGWVQLCNAHGASCTAHWLFGPSATDVARWVATDDDGASVHGVQL